jgi:hypothetical protein
MRFNGPLQQIEEDLRLEVRLLTPGKNEPGTVGLHSEMVNRSKSREK